MTCRLLSMDIPALVILLSLAWTGPYMVAGQEFFNVIDNTAYITDGSGDVDGDGKSVTDDNLILVTNRPTQAPRAPVPTQPSRGGEERGEPCNFRTRCEQLCYVVGGHPVCDCYEGYYLISDGGTCRDINECEGRPCGPNANCQNTVGSYRCTCLPGFIMSPDGTCTDLDECENNPDLCGFGEFCINRPGSFECACLPGYYNTSTGCADINECDNRPCPDDTPCYNTPGSYYCQCPRGYTYENGKCTDVDECLEDKELVCPGVGRCVNIIGSYSCVCPPGYQANETGCQDINECKTGEHKCDENAFCGNIWGSYFCKCLRGFRGDGYKCTDVNECLTEENNCQQKCVNTPGGFSCDCKTGFYLEIDGRSCTDTQSCDRQNGGCAHVCKATRVGDFECSCRLGYLLSHNGKDCNDIDECSMNNGDCDQMCLNTEGSYYCACKTGYRKLITNKLKCEAICDPPCRGNEVCSSPGKCTCPAGFSQPGCVPLCKPYCQHGGKCIGRNKCKCPYGWKGPSCAIAQCTPRCRNGGRCVAVNRCQCPVGYRGTRCEIDCRQGNRGLGYNGYGGYNPSRNNGYNNNGYARNGYSSNGYGYQSYQRPQETPTCNPKCLNGGVCAGYNYCRCPSGYTGNRCQVAKARPLDLELAGVECKPSCQNGGICVPGNKCECPQGFEGISCEKRVCPIVSFTMPVQRGIRQNVRVPVTVGCGMFGWNKCTQYQTVPKYIYRTVYRVGYRRQCQPGARPLLAPPRQQEFTRFRK